jgi:hypothetical protein
MNIRPILCLRLLGLAAVLPGGLYAARATSDLQPPQKRQATVDTGGRIAERNTPPELPPELASPFNPPGFNKSDSPVAQGSAQAEGPTAPPPPPGDREILEAVAAQLNPTGTIQFGNTPRLVMGSKRFQVGTRFIVTYNNQDYELELVAINRTTFTLRYRGEEITRPIKSVR